MKFKKVLLILTLMFSLILFTGCQISFDENGGINFNTGEQTQEESNIDSQAQDPIISLPNEEEDPVVEPTEPTSPTEEDPVVIPADPTEEGPIVEPTEPVDPIVEEEPVTEPSNPYNETEEPVQECPAPEPCPTPEPCPAPEPCPTCPEPEEPYFTEDRLMETRNIIRESNIFITTTKYEKSFANTLRVSGTSLGSGVVYKEDATHYYVITNNHVIDGGTSYQVEYTVKTFHGYETEGILVYTDSSMDLAVIKFSKNGNVVPLIDIYEREFTPLSDSEFLLAVGNPSGVNNVVTFGLYKGMSRIANVSFQVINHSVLIYPGNSGGALTDLYGNLVGINTWGDETNDENNFAVPIKTVLDFLRTNNLI